MLTQMQRPQWLPRGDGASLRPSWPVRPSWGSRGPGDFLLPPSSATASRLPFGQAQSVSTVKGALDGTVTATASQPSNPPSLAIDGDASTAWCIASWPDTLTVDLGQLGPLDGAGISLERIAANRWYSGLCLRFDQAGLGEQ